MRIFVEPRQLAAGALVVAGDEHHYLARVRRARVGDAIELVDGAGRRARAVIAAIAEAATTLEVGAVEDAIGALPRVCALVPWIKGDRMDLCVEKLVEVGVDDIVVWPATHAVVRLEPPRAAARIAKLAAAAVAAARQAGRAQVPRIALAADLAAAVAALPAGGARLVLDPTAEAPLALGDAGIDDVAVVSGPEGGIAPAELEQLARAGFAPLGLGPRVLRAETAPVIAVALIRAATRS